MRAVVLTFATIIVGLLQAALAGAQRMEDATLSENAVLRDAAIPAAGNPKGDITIVEYFDFQCPYCKKVHPDLERVLQDDNGVRLVYKDWPIFGGVSVYAARMALAAKYQDKFIAAHNALIESKQRLSESVVRELLTAAGVDVERADRDLATHQAEIEAILARNAAQAKAFGFAGTPAFIVGRFRVPGVLDADGFKHAIKDARLQAQK